MNLYLPHVQWGRMGTSRKAQARCSHVGVLVAAFFLLPFFCHARSNPAEMSLIMEVCRECLVGVLQFLFP